MLTGFRIYSSDPLWRQILTDFNATVLDGVKFADVNLDELELSLPISPIKLKTVIANAIDGADIVSRIVGGRRMPSHLPAQIIVWLYKTGGMSASDLKVALGYAPNANTHTVDTAICAMRREYGRDFIVNDNGVYKLGGV